MELFKEAISFSLKLGASYADIRIQETDTQNIYMEDLQVKVNRESKLYGYGVRVLLNGTWGFAHSNDFEKDTLFRTVESAISNAKLLGRFNQGREIKLAPERSYIDSFKTDIEIDPFKVPISEKLELMREINQTIINFPDIKKAEFSMISRKDRKTFISSLGSVINSDTTYINPTITAYAVTKNGSQSRTYSKGGRGEGYEFVLRENLIEQAKRIAVEAKLKADADSLGEIKRRDLLLDPYNLSLTMHESVGHPTEYDRVLGWEADMAGLSFATPEKLKNYQYGSKIVNFLADNNLKGGLATNGYDDDGVPNQTWHIIKDGILNEYGTTRDNAHYLGEQSRGCSRATNYYDFPINRIPNLYLEAGKEPLSPEQTYCRYKRWCPH